MRRKLRFVSPIPLAIETLSGRVSRFPFVSAVLAPLRSRYCSRVTSFAAPVRGASRCSAPPYSTYVYFRSPIRPQPSNTNSSLGVVSSSPRVSVSWLWVS
jgi:hypothetical protein